MTTTTNRTGYFVIFSYLGIGDADSRETTVYLEPGQSFLSISQIIADGRNLSEVSVILFAVDELEGLTSERANEMRAVGKAWDVARREANNER